MVTEKIIESNLVYGLLEVNGKFGKEITVVPRKGRFLQLTPFGAADIARRLPNWSANNDVDIGKRYPSFTGHFNQFM